MDKITLAILASIVIMAFTQCVYNNEEDLYPIIDGCDTIGVSYANEVLPVIINNCYRCHDALNNTSGITLEGYDQLSIYAASGQLLGVIRHDSGFSQMPADAPKIDDCEISKIEGWIADGYPNN